MKGNSKLKKQIQSHQYDLSEIPVDVLLSNPGFQVKLRHYAHIVERYNDWLEWDLEYLRELMGEEGFEDTSFLGYSIFGFKKAAEESGLERSRLNYGIQVAKNLALVDNVIRIQTIGAESRLESRSKERGINDLDLWIDFSEKPTERDKDLMFFVKDDAEKKTGIEIDLMGYGIPIAQHALEHYCAIFHGPIGLRGFPIYWRNTKYLDRFLDMKNKDYDEQMAELKRRGYR